MILHQVNKLLFKNVAKSCCRSCTGIQFGIRRYTKVLFPFESKKLMKISGSDTSEFLQGLITNDMRHFEDGSNSMYAMFLNNKGKVLYDTLLHKWNENETFIIECDKSVFKSLFNHLTLFRLKRKVNFIDYSDQINLWGIVSTSSDWPDLENYEDSDIRIYKDPRLPELGCRILVSGDIKNFELANIISPNTLTGQEDVYKYLRYKLGICEGPEDMPPGSCFPLEMNCDYLHGVSFHKGCYIGQELTARIHHTGVVRKRIMPIKFTESVPDNINNPVIAPNDGNNVVLGKLKGFIHDVGIGLLRHKEALAAKIMMVGDHKVDIVKPTWWPIEAPKEKTIQQTKLQTE